MSLPVPRTRPANRRPRPIQYFQKDTHLANGASIKPAPRLPTYSVDDENQTTGSGTVQLL